MWRKRSGAAENACEDKTCWEQKRCGEVIHLDPSGSEENRWGPINVEKVWNRWDAWGNEKQASWFTHFYALTRGILEVSETSFRLYTKGSFVIWFPYGPASHLITVFLLPVFIVHPFSSAVQQALLSSDFSLRTGNMCWGKGDKEQGPVRRWQDFPVAMQASQGKMECSLQSQQPVQRPWGMREQLTGNKTGGWPKRCGCVTHFQSFWTPARIWANAWNGQAAQQTPLPPRKAFFLFFFSIPYNSTCPSRTRTEMKEEAVAGEEGRVEAEWGSSEWVCVFGKCSPNDSPQKTG